MAAATAMTTQHDTATRALVVGLGSTGLSCARYLQQRGYAVTVVDSRAEPPMAARLHQEFPGLPVHLGDFNAAPWDSVDMIVVSPGVPIDELPLAGVRDGATEIVGDVELFARAVTVPVLAVTGSNGKSTVASLAGAMAQAQGLDAVVAGNIGLPVLDALQRSPQPALYILELSSFQLETTSSLKCAAAAVLNISEDHMDRYPDLATYAAAKARVFANCELAIVNRDDPLTREIAPLDLPSISIGTDPPHRSEDYGIAMTRDGECLVRGDQILMPCAQIPLLGRHNHLNVLAAMALAAAGGVDDGAMIAATRSFSALPHRMQTVAELDGVRFIDDSKGTNVGATCAALRGMSEPVVLIAGGDGKGADFSPLRPALTNKARALVLIGRDADRIARAVGDTIPVRFAASMQDAVLQARALARSGDAVLLSPACASFDMFDNYIARGEAFRKAVQELGS